MITDLSLSLATLGKIFIDAGDNCGPQNVLSNLNKLRFLKAELRKASRASSVWLLMNARPHISTDGVCL